MTITNLNIFQSGTLASPIPVNENFETIRVAVNTVEQSVTTNRTYLDNKLTELNTSISETASGTQLKGEVFCVNKGNYNEYNEPDILSISDSTLSFITPFTATNTEGKILEFNSISPISISGYADGVYNVFIDLEKNIEILNTNICRQQEEPSHIINTIWLDTSNFPLEAKRYTSQGWENFSKIPLGCFTVDEGTVSEIKTFKYNQNGYKINTSSNFPMPDFSKGVNKSNGIEYTAETPGWLFIYFGSYNIVSGANIVINGVSFQATNLFYAGTTIYSDGSFFIPISKGSVYITTNILETRFYPIMTI